MSTIAGSTQAAKSGLKIHLDFSNKRCYSPNLMNYSIWTTGSGAIVGNNTMYGITEYNLNGSVAESVRVLGADPFGMTSAVVWRSSTIDEPYLGPGGSQPDGGWNSGYIDIDSSKTYRFSVWAKKNTGIASSGTIYLGHYPGLPIGTTWSALKNTGNISEGFNPYFHYMEPVSPPSLGGADVWTLIVGHVWPYSTAPGTIETGSNISNPSLAVNYAHPDSGVWTVSSGKVGNLRNSTSAIEVNGSDWIWNPRASRVNHRTYLFYGATMTPPATASFIYPRIDVVDGFEPTIQELLQGPEPARNLVGEGTVYAYHQTNYSPQFGGMIKTETSKFMGFIGTASGTFSVHAASIWFRPNSNVTSSSTGQVLFRLGAYVTGTSNIGSDGFQLSLGPTTALYPRPVPAPQIGETIVLAGQSASNASVANTRTVVPGITIEGGIWHNILVNWNGSEYDIYLDGEIKETNYGTEGHVNVQVLTGYAMLGGRLAAGVAPVSFDGDLSSMMVWERPLESDEISSIWMRGRAKFR